VTSWRLQVPQDTHLTQARLDVATLRVNLTAPSSHFDGRRLDCVYGQRNMPRADLPFKFKRALHHLCCCAFYAPSARARTPRLAGAGCVRRPSPTFAAQRDVR
jgi:hypothetical protein